MTQEKKTRIVTWEDPIPGAAAAREMTGLPFLRAILAGEQPPPPIADLMGFEPLEVEEGRACSYVRPPSTTTIRSVWCTGALSAPSSIR